MYFFGALSSGLTVQALGWMVSRRGSSVVDAGRVDTGLVERIR